MGEIKATYSNPDLEQKYRVNGYWDDGLLTDFLKESAARHPGREVAVDNSGRTITFGDLLEKSTCLAKALRQMGVEKGDVVSFQLPNWVETLIVWYGILLCGAVANPIIPIYRAKEVKYILNCCRSKVIFVPAEFRRFNYLAMLEEFSGDLESLKHVIAVRGRAGGALCLDDLLDGPAPGQDLPQSRPDDIVLVLFTSGTTAEPKGTLHTHNTLRFENKTHVVEYFQMSDQDVIFMPSPLTHITGVNCGMILPACLGSKVVLLDAWNSETALEMMERERCTFFLGATAFYETMYRSPQWKERDLSCVRQMISGGADIPALLMQRIQEDLPNAVVTRMYGMSELSSASCSKRDEGLEKRLRTDGRFMFPSRGRIVTGDGQPAKAGDQGEIEVQGPELFRGYLQAHLNKDAFTADGWFRTGDMGIMDEDGYIRISGRKKDIIIRGGENISAKEVEDLIYSHPKVREVAVVGMPDEILGEKVCAYIVPTGGEGVTLAEVVQFLKNKGLATQKIPERLEIVPEFPYTSSGKVQKHILRTRIREIVEGAKA